METFAIAKTAATVVAEFPALDKEGQEWLDPALQNNSGCLQEPCQLHFGLLKPNTIPTG